MKLERAKLVLQVTGSEAELASLPRRTLPRHQRQQPLRSNSCIIFFLATAVYTTGNELEILPPDSVFPRAQFQHHPSGKVQVSLHANRHFPRGSFICTQFPRGPCTSPAFSPLNNPPGHRQALPNGRKPLRPRAAGKAAGIGNPLRKHPPPCLAQAPSAEGCSPRTDASRNVKDTAQVKSTSFAL